MARQLPLFADIAVETKSMDISPSLVHRNDPPTSREAAERLVRSGRLGRQQRAVLEALRQCNGATHGEVGRKMGTHWLVAVRRLPELERAGLVRKGEVRTCTIKKSRCVTWWITEDSR